jgi:zinc protease
VKQAIVKGAVMKRFLLLLGACSSLAWAGPEGGGFTQGPITALARLESVKALSGEHEAARRHFKVQSWLTAKGARVLFVRADELPMLDLHLAFDAGGARDGKQPGLAYLTSAMLAEGTPTRDTTQIASALEGLGADFHRGSYRDMGVVDLRVLTDPQFLKPALEVFTDVLAHPAFPEPSFQRVSLGAQVGLREQLQSPGAQTDLLFYRSLYPGHPYGSPPQGTPESLAALTTADLHAFHQRYYVARNMVIALVGDISNAQARSIAEQVSNALPEGQPAPALPPVPALTGMKTAHLDFASAQTHIVLGAPGVTRADPDYAALYVGNEILGGGGFGSLLMQEIREKRGLTYGVSSGFTPMREQGPFRISLSTRADQSDQALQIARQVLQSFVDNGPTVPQVSDTIANIVGNYPLDQASNGSIVGNLGMIGFYGLPLDYLDNFIQSVQKVTPAQIRTAFKRHVQPDHMLLVTVGKKAPVLQ